MKKIYILIACSVVLVIAVIAVVSSNHRPAASPAVTKDGSYVAFGDSVAAGIGLADYSDSSACDRTNQSYPNKVAAELHYTLTNVACSGATTQNGLIGEQNVNNLSTPPQINAVLSGAKPKLITVTISANDADWTTYIQKCYTGVCGSESDTAAANAGVANASNNLVNALEQIRQKYPTDTPKVIITGYYRLFPSNPAATCSEVSGVDSGELAWIAQLQETIDSSLRSATNDSDFATFLPIDFSGHELCSKDPWIQGLSGKKPYHPTDQGQSALAKQIVTAVKSGAAK